MLVEKYIEWSFLNVEHFEEENEEEEEDDLEEPEEIELCPPEDAEHVEDTRSFVSSGKATVTCSSDTKAQVSFSDQNLSVVVTVVVFAVNTY